MKKFVIIISLISICLISEAQTVRIAAAGSLKFILEEIQALYISKNPKAGIEFQFGASGTLSQQIMNGAGYDLFMAADKDFPEKLKKRGFTMGEVKTYAFGKLVLWSNSVDVSKGIEILNSGSVRHIAIAKPEISPYGARAVECLKYYRFYDQVKNKLVFAENIAQTAQFAVSGNAEAGIIALSIALSPEIKGKGCYTELDPKSYKPVEQAMVLIKNQKLNHEAKKFMDFVLSAACEPVFEKYGFIVP